MKFCHETHTLNFVSQIMNHCFAPRRILRSQQVIYQILISIFLCFSSNIKRITHDMNENFCCSRETKKFDKQGYNTIIKA